MLASEKSGKKKLKDKAGTENNGKKLGEQLRVTACFELGTC